MKKPDRKPDNGSRGKGPDERKKDFGKFRGAGKPKPRAAKKPGKAPSENDPIRLNKYISNSGMCSRRDADVMISTGVVSINGKIVTEMGAKVLPGDLVKYDGQSIKPERKQYVLLNKPKNFITTMDDPMGRKTVMGLVKGATKERIYPVGRLDRDTTGLLLFTNDGELTTRLLHPSQGVKKLYHITLRQKVQHHHIKQIEEGIELEDGVIKPDSIAYVGDGTNLYEVGIEIHSGKNRIVRRIFEHFGYTVQKLDRVVFCGLTKKDLPRGTWRELSKEEVSFLYMNS
ncbi:MAG: 23S rRNA pseudouridine2605 synthase [Flavobacteriales bacterium]|jgi:23S rRNA pseudouridine2605 synthase